MPLAPRRATLERVICSQPVRNCTQVVENSAGRSSPYACADDGLGVAGDPARRPRRGRQEHDRVRDRRSRGSSSTRGSRSRATSTSASTSSFPTSATCEDRDVLAVVLTHAHEDHVGALPYLLREVKVHEVWATRLTLGMIGSKLDEHGLQRSTELREIDPEGPPLDLGPFRLEFVRMAHSVPDAVGIAIETAAGRVFHTGRLEARPHAGRRAAHRRRQARRARQPRRRPAARATRRTPSGPASRAPSASSARRSARSSRSEPAAS